MSRVVAVTLIFSVFLHVLVAAYFWSSRRAGPALKQGSIAVDLIQSVPGERFEDPHNHPGRKAKRQMTRKTPERSSQTQQNEQPPGDPNGSAKESDLYIAQVSRLIAARKIYPRSAVDREEEGKVILGVTLDREGHVVESKIETASPFESLNAAALDTIKAVGQFPPIPPEVPDPIHLHVPLIFKVETR